MTSPSLAGYLAAGPSSAQQAEATDLYVDRATGNLVVRLASGTQMQVSPTGQILSSGGVDLAAAVAAQVLLVNGGFEVMQRAGPSFTASLAYAHDRWQIILGGTSTITVTDETTIVDTGSGHALKAVYVQGSANSSIDQKLEAFAQLRGRTVTLAVRVRKGVASSVRPYIADSGVKTYGTATATTGAYETLTATLAIGAAASSVTVGVEISASDTVYCDSATLAIGAAAAAYVPVDPAREVAQCKRYYQEYGGLGTGEHVAAMKVNTTTGASGAVVFGVEMAVAPTMTVSAAADWAVLDAAGALVACTVLSSAAITRRGCVLNATVAAGLVAGNASLLRANATLSARIVFEANP